ncbi:MAG: DsbA family protein [Rhodobacteraceae bacterium]|jgi:protein-disulfide isomerase|nr:DsbA family protein [Paracoccaceae bacterium]
MLRSLARVLALAALALALPAGLGGTLPAAPGAARADTAAGTAAAAPAAIADPAPPGFPADVAMDMALGNPEAKVTLVEYASFTCPHCANFHATVFPRLKSDYIDTGKLRFIHREVYFDRFGLWAGMLARCGGETRYFGFVDMIYGQQRQWAGSGDPASVADSLRRMGRVAGLTDEQVNACLNDRTAAEALVAVFQANATRDGVQATPTLVLNGTRHANMSFEELARLIDAALAD